MAFYSSLLGGAGAPSFGSAGGSPSAFTSPGLNPQTLAALLSMQGGAGASPQMSPQLPPPPALGAHATPAGMTPPNPAQAQNNPLFASLLANPALLKQMLGIGGAAQGINGAAAGANAAANAVQQAGGGKTGILSQL